MIRIVMPLFTRDDGTRLAVVPGFRKRMLSYRAAVSPRENWSDSDYAAAAAKRQRRWQRLRAGFEAVAGPLTGKRVLDVGCGDASNVLLLAAAGACAHGIDLALPLFDDGARGEQTRRFAAHLVGDRTCLPIALASMDATAMTFADGMFDWVMSRSAMEHVQPVERALAEMVRVTRPGGLLYLGIDPFFWVRGCHKHGVVDIPFAHARLSLDEFARFVTEHEGEARAAMRSGRLATLNRYTLAEWHRIVMATGCEVLSWQEEFSAIGNEVLGHFPEVSDTLRDGVLRDDLLCERIKVWLRKPG